MCAFLAGPPLLVGQIMPLGLSTPAAGCVVPDAVEPSALPVVAYAGPAAGEGAPEPPVAPLHLDARAGLQQGRRDWLLRGHRSCRLGRRPCRGPGRRLGAGGISQSMNLREFTAGLSRLVSSISTSRGPYPALGALGAVKRVRAAVIAGAAGAGPAAAAAITSTKREPEECWRPRRESHSR